MTNGWRKTVALAVVIASAAAVGSEPSSSCTPTITTFAHLSFPQQIQINGSRALVSDSSGALFVFDVAIPSDPVQTGAQIVPEVGRFSAFGGLAVVATKLTELAVLEISSSGGLKEQGRLDIEPGISAVAASDGVVYVTTRSPSPISTTDNQLKVVDISDPENPTEAASYAFDGYLGGAMTVHERQLWIPLGGFGLKVLDVSDPLHPVEIGGIELDGGVRDMVVEDDVVYTLSEDGLTVIDASDPSALEIVGRYLNPGWSGVDLAVSEGLAAISIDNGWSPWIIVFLDVSVAEEPTLISEMSTEPHLTDVALRGRDLFTTRVRFYEGQMEIFDVLDPSQPSPLASVDRRRLRWIECVGEHAFLPSEDLLLIYPLAAAPDPPMTGMYRAQSAISDAVFDGDVGFLAVGDDGIEIVDFSDPTLPVQIAWEDPSVTARDLVLSGDRLVVSSGPGFAIIDISIPRLPAEIGSFVMPLGRSAGVMALWNDVLYIGSGDCSASSHCDNELWIVEISDPGQPVFAPLFELPHDWLSGLSISDGLAALVFTQDPDLVVLDLSIPTHPLVVATHEIPVDEWWGFRDIDFVDRTAFLAGLDPAFQQVDLSYPTIAKIRGSSHEGTWSRSVSVSDDRACVVLEESQVVVLDVSSAHVCEPPRKPGGRRSVTFSAHGPAPDPDRR